MSHLTMEPMPKDLYHVGRSALLGKKYFDPQLRQESNLSILERVLSRLRYTNLFSFFVSILGRISPPAQTRLVGSHQRIFEVTLRSVPPFTDLGFDHLMTGRQVGKIGAQTLAEVTELECVVHMGRPLSVRLHLKAYRFSYVL
ncbi:uncharacterized protein BT62DRAFT_937211 [Guyanagaster necrorhizus]|uniref:Uncharacterized protein n=1 Tax=Guyanagaster necrorhizus TaxID=856835 RepID=A0A9P7VIR7_9AGAR|nr:uncharacterized protein BT62DRAFT_937211 [Guyanagaster necrorhizus MCA 3950]KAG7441444.1 hypothetical protein BT62DRAFT_937211 [Guyanagaster necrorhizus MCA 3950]